MGLVVDFTVDLICLQLRFLVVCGSDCWFGLMLVFVTGFVLASMVACLF